MIPKTEPKFKYQKAFAKHIKEMEKEDETKNKISDARRILKKRKIWCQAI